jgi:hypothetical protein
VSQFYETDPSDPDAPVVLDEWHDLRPGMAVRYTGPIPLHGPLVIWELVRFSGDGTEAGWVTAVLNNGEYEVDAANLRPTEEVQRAREDYALDRLDVAGPVPAAEARRRAEARRQDGRPDAAIYWDAYAAEGEREAQRLSPPSPDAQA